MPRGYGKTYQLIKKSAETGDYIVCTNRIQASELQNKASELGLKIPLPITFEDFLKRNHLGTNIKGILIDNADMLLECISKIPINAITMSI